MPNQRPLTRNRGETNMSFADRRRNQAARAFIGRSATAAATRLGAALRGGRSRATTTLNAVRNRVALRRGQAGKRPRFSIGPSAGRFRKPKKAKLVKGILLKRECFGTIDTRNAAYVGFQTTSGRDNLTRSFAESLLRDGHAKGILRATFRAGFRAK
jgi:hypothetical protein